MAKAQEITDLGQHPYCGDEVNSAHGLQGLYYLGKRPLRDRLPDRLLKTLDTLVFLAHPLKELFESNPVLTMLELLRPQPVHVGRPPRLLAHIAAPEPQHQRRDLLAL